MNAKTVNVKLFGFFPMLVLLFIALKLCGVIDWSWALVLAPLYGPPILGFVFLVAVLVVTAVLYPLDKQR